MIINELENAYLEFEKLLYENDVNGKRIIEILLKIQNLEQKLIYEMFYNLLLAKIINDDIESLCADISCKIKSDILIDPIRNVNMDKQTYRSIIKLKNKLNYKFDKFIFNSNEEFDDLCFLLSKYNENDSQNKYWLLKNFLNKRFNILEEEYEKTKQG